MQNKEPHNSKILIAGVVRNSEKIIFKELGRIPQCFSDFKDYRLIVIESDSDDRTANKIKLAAKNNSKIIPICLHELRRKYPDKIERLAFCRNIYIHEFLQNPLFSTYDYLAVIDFDGAARHLSRSAIQSCWKMSLEWEVVTCNRSGRYTDLYALRHQVWQPNDCWEHYNEIRKILPEQISKELAISSKMIRLDEDIQPFYVDSAFCGMAIYRRDCLGNARYSATDANGVNVCEHVALHEQITKKGNRIALNPKLIVYIERELSLPKIIKRFMLNRFPKYF